MSEEKMLFNRIKHLAINLTKDWQDTLQKAVKLYWENVNSQTSHRTVGAISTPLLLVLWLPFSCKINITGGKYTAEFDFDSTKGKQKTWPFCFLQTDFQGCILPVFLKTHPSFCWYKKTKWLFPFRTHEVEWTCYVEALNWSFYWIAKATPQRPEKQKELTRKSHLNALTWTNVLNRR